MSPNFDQKAFDLFRGSLSPQDADRAYDLWYRLSYAGRLAWSDRVSGKNKQLDESKWCHLTVRLKRDERDILAAAAVRNNVDLQSFMRFIVVDAVQDELERAAKGRVAPSPRNGVLAAPAKSPDPV